MALLLKNGNSNFPKNLSELKIVKHFPGGSGGVYLVQDAAGKPFILKLANSEEQLKQEVLAQHIYRECGVLVPDVAVYTDYTELSPELRNAIAVNPEQNLFVLYEYIETISEDKMTAEQTAEFNKGFVVDAFLCNWDVGFARNVIVSPQGAYRVDLGAGLLFRACGGEKSFAPHVLELTSLRDEKLNSAAAKQFAALTESQIQSQRIALAKKGWNILEIFNQLNEKLQFNEAEHARNLILARLNSLVFDDFKARSSNFPAEEGVAAGIFPIAYLANKPHVLLGRRRSARYENRYWCTPGGKKEVSDQSLAETATRETREETLHLLSFDAKQLAYALTFDIELQTGGFYRTFVMPVNDATIAAFQGVKTLARQLTHHMHFAEGEHGEYEEFAWIPLEELTYASQAGLASVVTTPYESHTIRQIELQPDFARLLQQADFLTTLKNWLQDHGHTEILLPYDEETLYKYLASKHLIESQVLLEIKQNQFALKKVDRADLSAQAQAYLAIDHLANIAEQAETAETPCLSELHLARVLGITEASFAEKVAAAVQLIRQQPDDKVTASLTHLLEIERAKAAKGFDTFYHAVPSDIALAYDLFTAFWQVIELNPQYTRFRLSDKPFQTLPNIAEFTAYFAQLGGGAIDNYAGDYQSYAISTNLFLFGNHFTARSCSFLLFCQNLSARLDDFKKLLENLLTVLGLPQALLENYFNELEHLRKNLKESGGRLYQIHIPHEIVDEVVYPSLSLGRQYFLQGKTKIPMSLLLEKLRQGEHDFDNDIHHLQARIFLDPRYINQMEVSQTIYDATAVPIGYLEQIKAIARNIIQRLFSDQQFHPFLLENKNVVGSSPYENYPLIRSFFYRNPYCPKDNFMVRLINYLKIGGDSSRMALMADPSFTLKWTQPQIIASAIRDVVYGNAAALNRLYLLAPNQSTATIQAIFSSNQMIVLTVDAIKREATDHSNKLPEEIRSLFLNKVILQVADMKELAGGLSECIYYYRNTYPYNSAQLPSSLLSGLFKRAMAHGASKKFTDEETMACFFASENFPPDFIKEVLTDTPVDFSQINIWFYIETLRALFLSHDEIYALCVKHFPQAYTDLNLFIEVIHAMHSLDKEYGWKALNYFTLTLTALPLNVISSILFIVSEKYLAGTILLLANQSFSISYDEKSYLLFCQFFKEQSLDDLLSIALEQLGLPTTADQVGVDCVTRRSLAM